MVFESSGRSNTGCLLPCGGHVETDPVLSLGHVEYLVSLLVEDHSLINLDEFVLRNSRVFVIVDQLTLLVNHSKTLHLVVLVNELHPLCEVEVVERRVGGG